jgi:DNA replication protein
LAESFPGFRSGSRATIVPNAFFTEVLPAVADPAELIVSTYIFFALGRRRGFPRSVSASSLRADPALMQALARLPAGGAAALATGLDLAVRRGTLLRTVATDSGQPVYLLNTEDARRVLADKLPAPIDSQPEVLAAEPRPSIFALYEENIGSIPPLLLDELEEAEQEHPWTWIEAAFREAAALNRRNWRYISRILDRWKTEGPDYEAPGGPAVVGSAHRKRSIAGPYRRVVD